MFWMILYHAHFSPYVEDALQYSQYRVMGDFSKIGGNGMTRAEAMEIIKKEKLNYYNFFEDRYHEEDELGIQKIGENKWVVYATTERAAILAGSEAFFETESDALEDFIDRLRAGKELEEMTNGEYH